MTNFGSQKAPKIEPKSDQKSMQKMIRKKYQNKTNLAPPKSQKPYKNVWKINKNQKITSTNFDRFLAPKTSQNGTPKRLKNDQKNNPKKNQKKSEKDTQN